jgi:hypothetical protein
MLACSVSCCVWYWPRGTAGPLSRCFPRRCSPSGQVGQNGVIEEEMIRAHSNRAAGAMRAPMERQSEEAGKIVRDIRRAARRHYTAGGLDQEKVCSSILGSGLTTRALVRGVAQPARAKSKPMLVDANTAHRQKSIKSAT